MDLTGHSTLLMAGWEFRFTYGYTAKVYCKGDWYILVDQGKVILGWLA